MKRNILVILIFYLFVNTSLHSENRNTEHLAALQQLLNNNLAYDAATPMDSVIAWGQQLAPTLEKENQTELFFRIKKLMVHIYSLRGDIGEAINEARQMYMKAESMNYTFGIALSSNAIGDAYYCSNMPKEAIESYKEAISYPNLSSGNHYYKERALLQLIAILTQEGQLEEAEHYRMMLLESEAINHNSTLQFLHSTTDVAYHIRRNNLQDAHASLQQAEKIYEADPQPYFRIPYLYSRGQYYEATGDYQLALQQYDRILDKTPNKTQSITYLQIAYAKAGLLIKMDDKEKAARLYEEISVITDSIVAPSYSNRINSLRLSFQENRMKVENKAEFNRIFMVGISAGIIVLAIIVFLTLYILRQNKKIAESKVRLEHSRIEAENAMQTKSLFISNMSHEIRTPLSALSGFSNLLTEQELDEETRRQCGEIIQQNSDLLLKLINDVLDLSNLETKNMKFSMGRHDAIAICNNVIDTVNKVKQTQAEVRFDTSLDALVLYTDDSRLQQLLINLLINATKFTPQGSIILGLEMQSKDFALFSVTDTGCGISLENQSKIFNRFEKLNEGDQGTGLGLSICQLIVERIGGKIWIDSTYTDGCRFYFTHPVESTEKGKEKMQ